MAKVRLINLCKRFGDFEAVRNINLTIDDGEFFCLLGPSGCGKTTTLRMIAGLETPTSGEMYIGDDLINDLSPAERDIAMVFQFYALYPGMTVYENLAFPLKARKVSKSEIDEQVKKIAQLLNLEKVLNKKATTLTVGEQQKVALGRAIIRSPRVYLLDEPLTNLDARTRAYMRVELAKLHEELKQTIIYVTHDQIEAIAMASKIGVMNLGVIQQVGTPDEIYGKPQNVFVAGFIGSPPMNFLDCSYKESRNELDFNSFKIPIPEDLSSKITTSELILGIRPEDIVVHLKKPGKYTLEAVIDNYELIGDKQMLHFQINHNSLVAVVPSDFPVEINRKLWLTFKDDKIHLFDRKNGFVI